MKLRLIAEGSTKKERKALRWGLSFLVGNVLFDAFGREDVFWENVRRFKIDLSRVKRVVISHEDWDHIAGLKDLLKARPGRSVFICKRSCRALKTLIRQSSGTLVEVDTPRKISAHIFSLGQMRADTGRGILYEQALVVKSRNGFSVITGCAHPGIVPIVRRAVKLFGKRVYAVCGGFHMKDHSREENLKTLFELQALGVKKVIPLHCTGQPAKKLFQKYYGVSCQELHEGASVVL